jgi:hypothetical protein
LRISGNELTWFNRGQWGPKFCPCFCFFIENLFCLGVKGQDRSMVELSRVWEVDAEALHNDLMDVMSVDP